MGSEMMEEMYRIRNDRTNRQTIIENLRMAAGCIALANQHWTKAVEYDEKRLTLKGFWIFTLLFAVPLFFVYGELLILLFKDISSINLSEMGTYAVLFLPPLITGILIATVIQNIRKKRLKAKADEEYKQAQQILADGSIYTVFIPQEYRTPVASAYIVKMMEDGRAATINDALKLTDQYLAMNRWH